MVLQGLVKLRLDGETNVQEVFVEGLLAFLCVNHCNTVGIESRTSGSTHHLQNVGQVHISVGLNLGVVELSALDDNQVSWQVDTPCKS